MKMEITMIQKSFFAIAATLMTVGAFSGTLAILNGSAASVSVSRTA
jgi:hypothetical protein